MTPLLPVYREHCESIGESSFLPVALGCDWRRLILTPLVFGVLVLLLAGCAFNRRQQQHSSDRSFFDSPDVDTLH